MRKLVALALVLSTTGCGATIATQEPGGAKVTVRNCGQEVTYDGAPSKVVTNDTGITEMMFALGLADRMAGYVIAGDNKGTDVSTSPWKADFERLPKLAEKINKEVVQGAGADMVFAGWGYGFSESTGFTPDVLEEQGIATYLLTETCRNGVGKQRGVMPPLEALYTDLRNLGAIFGVSARAEELIAGYQRQVAGAEELVRGRPKPKVFLYDSGLDQPYTSGKNAAPQDIIGRAGGENIFGDLDDSWTAVGWETVVERNPDVILINDYADGDLSTPQQKQAFLESYAPLKEVPAVRDKRFFALPYAALVEGPRNPAAIEAFARFLAGG
ncbi:ABC transporter substrate-binding protein [Saccharothrix algeriensis]|uniref:Iron complex transport system substrate-binding protein n=3 Tax=Saccharothrix algeriensis TaxID=173560 RepID=A0ABS2SAN5_9PSEU|nr:ABC transporter substrate-binding protein [Saccharothrix algeriensis]MBM7813307.1 iron complex transport system substrate-binding protein [Saccharothrix algeriensis]